MAYSLEKLLFQKPLLEPCECRVIIFHGDHNGGLAHDPVPEPFRHGPQPDAHAADDHEQQPAGSEVVPASQYIFQEFEHIPFFLTGAKPEFVSEYATSICCRGTSDRVWRSIR